MENTLLTRQQMLFGISPEQAQRQVELERAKDDARRRGLSRLRDYAESNNLPLLMEKVEALRSQPRAVPKVPVADDVSEAAVATGGVPAQAVAVPSEPEVPADIELAVPEAPTEPQAPIEPETTPEPSNDEVDLALTPDGTSEPEVPTAADLVENGAPADDEPSDATLTNGPSDNEV